MRYVAFTFILPTSISYMVIAFGLAVYSDLSKWINEQTFGFLVVL